MCICQVRPHVFHSLLVTSSLALFYLIPFAAVVWARHVTRSLPQGGGDEARFVTMGAFHLTKTSDLNFRQLPVANGTAFFG